MIKSLRDLTRLLFVQKARHKLIIKHLQLKVNVIGNLVVLDLQINKAEGLHTLHNFPKYR